MIFDIIYQLQVFILKGTPYRHSHQKGSFLLYVIYGWPLIEFIVFFHSALQNTIFIRPFDIIILNRPFAIGQISLTHFQALRNQLNVKIGQILNNRINFRTQYCVVLGPVRPITLSEGVTGMFLEQFYCSFHSVLFDP